MAGSRRIAVAGLALPLLLLAAAPSGATDPPAWHGKVDPWVLETATASVETEFIVFLAAQADLGGARELPTKLEKGHFVYQSLSGLAERTQEPVLEHLRQLGVEHRSYWVANMIWVQGSLETVEAMARRPDVAHVYANPWVPIQLPNPMTGPEAPEAVEPNITHTGAPDEFWDNGFTGQGVVVGGQDTGYDWDHPALIDAYRGWDGVSADHDFNWHDAIHSGGGVCGADSPFPCDDNGHGTHTMGTMVGDDGGSNQIGMAPGAEWIGCRNMNQGFGTPTTYSECFEWFIAPTDVNGDNPDPSKAPDVINNSWACPDFEGCTDPNVLLSVVQAVRAAGIFIAVSAGNEGSGCESVQYPAAIYDESFSVGATNNSDIITSFSSRGPVTVDGSNRLKPDLSAPGDFIRSSWVGGGYTFLSGTSMAAPHVAGAVALVGSAADCLVGDVDGMEDYLISTAVPRTTTQQCGDVPGDEVPNNTYGWGALRTVLPATDFCDGGGIPCEDVQTFQARCIAGGPGNRLQFRVVLTDTSHDGETVTVEVDGDANVVTISGRRAQMSINGAATGEHTVELVDPAGCFPLEMVTCP